MLPNRLVSQQKFNDLLHQNVGILKQAPPERVQWNADNEDRLRAQAQLFARSDTALEAERNLGVPLHVLFDEIMRSKRFATFEGVRSTLIAQCKAAVRFLDAKPAERTRILFIRGNLLLTMIAARESTLVDHVHFVTDSLEAVLALVSDKSRSVKAVDIIYITDAFMSAVSVFGHGFETLGDIAQRLTGTRDALRVVLVATFADASEVQYIHQRDRRISVHACAADLYGTPYERLVERNPRLRAAVSALEISGAAIVSGEEAVAADDYLQFLTGATVDWSSDFYKFFKQCCFLRRPLVAFEYAAPGSVLVHSHFLLDGAMPLLKVAPAVRKLILPDSSIPSSLAVINLRVGPARRLIVNATWSDIIGAL